MTFTPLTCCHLVVLASDHFVNGDVDLYDQRLSDFLNDKRESTVEMTDATIARINAPGKLLGKYTKAVVPKAAIVVAFEVREKSVAPPKRFYSYVSKAKHPVFVTAHGLELRGSIHAMGPLDYLGIISGREAKFVPITDVTVSFSTNDRFQIRQDAILVNVGHIQFMAELEPEVSAPEPEPEPKASEDQE